MRLAIRGFDGRRLVFEEFAEGSLEELGGLLPAMAERHAAVLPARHMIEVEFLDEPNPYERFFRFGTDASGMVAPVGFVLPRNDRSGCG